MLFNMKKSDKMVCNRFYKFKKYLRFYLLWISTVTINVFYKAFPNEL